MNTDIQRKAPLLVLWLKHTIPMKAPTAPNSVHKTCKVHSDILHSSSTKDSEKLIVIEILAISFYIFLHGNKNYLSSSRDRGNNVFHIIEKVYDNFGANKSRKQRKAQSKLIICTVNVYLDAPRLILGCHCTTNTYAPRS